MNPGDERNLAHSAVGRNPMVEMDSGEIVKLKKEHQKEIQKLTYESKIEMMESQMKTMQLEKENQTLSHQFEMFKLKNSYDSQSSQAQADQQLQKQKDELQNKLVEKEKQLVAKEHEMVLYKKEQENEWKMKMKDLENEHKIKMLQKEVKIAEMEKVMKENEETIQKMRAEMKTVNEQAVKKESARLDTPVKALTDIDRMVWGANYFIQGISHGPKLYESYEKWYERISLLMENKKLYVATEFLFIRKKFDKHHKVLHFVSKRKYSAYKDCSDEFNTEGLTKELYTNDGVDLFLLHPKIDTKHLKFNRNFNGHDYERWQVKNVNLEFYDDNNDAIVLGIPKINAGWLFWSNFTRLKFESKKIVN
uniref:Uncharacterized protein n=1 Tax=Clytia hemisphaerica TaxID=252671 RepID=A0A7M6DM60_9CNID